MGHRCNMIVTERGQADVRYSHWGAHSILADALNGPGPFVEMIRSCSKAEAPSHRLDTVWAEGIALVDLDSKELLIWGGVVIKYLHPVRAAYLQLLTPAWHGWRVAWCAQGIADAWRRLGVTTPDVAPVIRPPDEKALNVITPTAFTWITVSANVVADYPFNPNTGELILVGPALLDYCAAREPGTPPLEDNLGGGLLIEPSKRVVWWWACDKLPSHEQVRSAWHGWDVRTLEGGLPEQINKSGRDGSAFALSRSTIEKYLTDELFPKNEFDPVEMMRRVREKGAAKGQEVRINPEAVKHPRADDSGRKH
jgi:hypothetical protein